jgi:hypothetical protein
LTSEISFHFLGEDADTPDVEETQHPEGCVASASHVAKVISSFLTSYTATSSFCYPFDDMVLYVKHALFPNLAVSV